MKLLMCFITVLGLQVLANPFLSLDDLKPVQYPILEKSSQTGKIQNLFIDFTQSLIDGCSRHYGLDYNASNILEQIRDLKFSRDVKSACLFPYLVHQLNQFTKEHLLRIKESNIPQGNVHLTLAARIYDGSFLTYISRLDPDEVAGRKFHQLYDISTHSAILFRMIRQTLEDAITISNPWYAQNSLDKTRDIRKVAAWISEITPWSYLYRLGFSTVCERTPFKPQCENDKKLVQVSLVKGLGLLRQHPDKYEYVAKLRDHIENVESTPKVHIRRGLQVLRGLSGDYVSYMLGPSVQVQGRLLKLDFKDTFQYLENAKKDMGQYVSANIDKISEEYSCKTILRSFISLQQEADFDLKNEMRHLNPFPQVNENTDILEDTITKNGMPIRDFLEKANCPKLRNLYGLPINEEGFGTRFLAYQGRIMLASTTSFFSEPMVGSELEEVLIYTQFEDVLLTIEKLLHVEEQILKGILNEKQKDQVEQVSQKIFTYIDSLFN